MASSIGSDFALERHDRLPRWDLETSDADETLRLPCADRTMTDLVSPHPDVIARLASSEAITLVDE